MFHNGRPVSGMCRLERDIIVRGHTLRIGFIGGVCTHPEHRKKGLASAVMQACLAKFRENNVDFVYISGTRPLYYGIGANHIGGVVNFTIRPGDLAAYKSCGVALRNASAEDCDLLASLSQAEGVRFVRPLSDYELSISCGHCSGKACAFRIIHLDGVPVGYVLTTGPTEKEPSKMQVLEYVGERLALLAILPRLAEEAGGTVVLTVPVRDRLDGLLAAAGVASQPGRTSGTIKVLDFGRTMRKLLPYFAGRVPADLVDGLSFAVAEGKYVVWSGREILEVEGERNMLWSLLGCPPGESIANVRATPMMQALLERCFPLPLPSLHVNMI
jgi:hypothetical protein